MEGITVIDIVDMLDSQGIKNKRGNSFNDDNVRLVIRKLRIKPIKEVSSRKGRKMFVFSENDAKRIIDFISKDYHKKRKIIKRNERMQVAEVGDNYVSYRELVKLIRKNNGRTKRGKKVEVKNIYDYVRWHNWSRYIKKIGRCTYIDNKKAKVIFEYYTNGVNSINKKGKKHCKNDLLIQEYKRRLENHVEIEKNLINEREELKQEIIAYMHENEELEKEVEFLKDELNRAIHVKKKRFLFW